MNRTRIAGGDRRLEAVVLDQVLFRLNDDQLRQFAALLEAPAEPNPGLARLAAVQAPWRPNVEA